MASHPEDDLTAEHTEGFKVGEKKTIDEYQQLGKSRLYPACTLLNCGVLRCPELFASELFLWCNRWLAWEMETAVYGI